MQRYDHIVIGAGSAGCAVAARLAEDPVRRVLLLEAGGHDLSLAARVPAAFPNQFHTKGDWDYYTEPEPGCDNRRIYEPRGKVLGGCSAMNAMLWIRGSRLDYDGWGLPGWSWEEVLPFFRRMECHFLRGDDWGAEGPMQILRLTAPDPVAEAFVESAAAAGIQKTDDVSGPDLDGVALAPTTTVGGRRWSTARGYLDPLRKAPNLTVMTNALVHRIVVRDGRAVGVVVERKGKVMELAAARDIVVSAGAFNTPHLLQLSGIGPADLLRDLGIDVVADSPAVGAHLREHPMTFCNFELREGWLGLSDATHPKHLVNWLLRGRGKLASNVAEAVAHIRTRPDAPAPDMQLVHAPTYFWDNGEAEHPAPAFCIAQSYWTPASSGTVRATTRDPHVKPAVQLNMLTERSDLEALLRGIAKAREIVRSGPLRDMVKAEIHPGEHVRTEAELERWVRQTCGHTYHPACTARMGEEGEGAVDHELRVHGVENLRVADASAMPEITRANTNAPAILMGERCAAFIKAADDERVRPRLRQHHQPVAAAV
ncbi:MAG TPA: GMC family oxidoreductase N-terminal domain-containing protein [Baekduia sp.]|nr:GMC family oxidoreductase N-terminal domain-containing protein [Baekduia sp.]